MKKLALLLLICSSIGSAQTVGQHWMWTVSGPRWSDFSGSAFNGGTITGDLLIQKTTPTFTVEATNNTPSYVIWKRSGASFPTTWYGYIAASSTALSFYNTTLAGTPLVLADDGSIWMPYYSTGAIPFFAGTGQILENPTKFSWDNSAYLLNIVGNQVIADNSAIRTMPLTLLNNYGTSANYVSSMIALGRTTANIWGAIAGSQRESATYSGGALKFLTETSDALGLQTKAIITYDGNMGIQDTTPAYDFTVGDGDLAGFDAGDMYGSSRFTYKVANAYTGSAYAILGMAATTGANKKWGLYDYVQNRLALEVDMATRTFTTYGPTVFNSQTYTWPASQGTAKTRLENDGAGNLTWEDERSTIGKYYTIFDDFVSSNGGGQSGGIAYTGGTGSSVTQGYSLATADSNRWGRLLLTTGTAAAAGAGEGWGTDNLTVGGGPIVFQADVRVNRRFPTGGTNAHTGAHTGDDWMIYVGLGDNVNVTGTTFSALSPTDGIYFYAHTDSNQTVTPGPSASWKWSVCASRNGTRVHHWGTGIAVDTVNIQTLRIETETNGAVISFYINNTLVDTIKNWLYIPTAVARATGVNIKINKFQAQASAPTANSMIIDNIFVRKTYNPSR